MHEFYLEPHNYTRIVTKKSEVLLREKHGSLATNYGQKREKIRQEEEALFIILFC